MAIGRADERDNPADSTAHVEPQKCLDIVRGTHLGQRSLQPHQQAGHMTAFEPSLYFCSLFLELSGPSTHESEPPIDPHRRPTVIRVPGTELS